MSKKRRVLRGGSFCSVTWDLRATFQNNLGSANRREVCGFRIIVRRRAI